MSLFQNYSRNQKNGIKPVVLLILDGYGIAPPSSGNAITQARTPNLNFYQENFLYTQLIAAGESVGLPANEDGNSEVGHLTIGAGRVIFQSLKRINLSIENGSFFENPALVGAVAHVRAQNSRLHVMGLVGSGNVHSSMNHLYAVIEFAKRNNIQHVFLHLFTDGRDAPPQEAKSIVAEIENKIQDMKLGTIASITGRYWALDRDRRWERTKSVYDALVLGKGVPANSSKEAIDRAYAQGQYDEFIPPTVVTKGGSPVGTIQDNDAVIFTNFRIDRPRQLTMAFTMPDFETVHNFMFGDVLEHTGHNEGITVNKTFVREKIMKNLFFVTMTEYQKGIPVSAIAFPPEDVQNSLSSVIAQAGLRQMHMAESEKERMVTFYFDGLKEERFAGEDTYIVSSPKVATYDKKPEMSVKKLVSQFKRVLARGEYHFIVLNFANPDMVAHSGNLKATIKAIEIVDKMVGELVSATLKADGTVLITADHGNAEELLTYENSSFYFTSEKGSVNTEHSDNPVPLFVIGNWAYKKGKQVPRGSLSDVAPTILGMMNIAIPTDMKGVNLLA